VLAWVSWATLGDCDMGIYPPLGGSMDRSWKEAVQGLPPVCVASIGMGVGNAALG
jgi:hypothetical protein